MALEEDDKHWIHGQVKELENLFMNVFHSLEREMRLGFDGLTVRFNDQASRLERHAALWRSGSTWSGGMDKWAERIDAAIETKDRQIAELTRRVNELERARE